MHCALQISLMLLYYTLAAMDPGFPRGCQPIIWPKFAENYMKMKKIGPRGGTRPKFYYVDPPLIRNSKARFYWVMSEEVYQDNSSS